MNKVNVLKEIILNSKVSKVWKALTDREEMQKWYFDIKEFKPEVGFEFNFTAGDDKRTFLHICKITKIVPQQMISYTWRYDGYEGESVVTFELFPEGEKTRLKLTHTGIETFKGPDFAKENFEHGWNHIIGTSLKEYFEK